MTTIQTKFPSVDRGRLNNAIQAIDASGADAATNTAHTIDITWPISLTSGLLGSTWDSGSSLTIAGSGAAGCEYASIFAALGTRVTIVGGSHLLPAVDAEMAGVPGECFNALGIRVIPKVSASALRWCLSPQNPR